MKLFFILLGCIFAICPLCPIIIGGAMKGGFSSGNPLIISAIASTASVPFLLAFLDGFRTRNMTFDFPSSEGVYHTGQTYDLFMHTFGLASRFHLRTADLYLLNSNFQKVLKIASDSEFKVLKNLTRSKTGMPQTAIGTMQFKIPKNISDGYYYIKYVSGWTIWRHESKFSAISNVFGITNDPKCNSFNCLKVSPAVIIDPKSFTAQSAPDELQFMFSHTDKAITKSLDGLIDGFAAIPKAIIHPNGLKHPIESSKNATAKWEKKFERDPFGATGQVVGLGLAIGIPTKLIVDKYKKCPGGLCGMISKDETHLFKVDGTSCNACTSTVKDFFTKKGFQIKMSPIEEDSVHVAIASRSIQPKELIEAISDVGFVAHYLGKIA